MKDDPFRPTPSQLASQRWALEGLLVVLRALRVLGHRAWVFILTRIFPLPALALYGLQRLGGMPPDTDTYSARAFRSYQNSPGLQLWTWISALVTFLTLPTMVFWVLFQSAEPARAAGMSVGIVGIFVVLVATSFD